jgi:hypothetical protein
MEIAKAMWEFLLDPQTREVLAWIVGLVAAFVGGSIIFKHIYRTKVSAKNHSFAAGRDINISDKTGPLPRRTRKKKR